jgi:hypothetical protein
MQMCNPFPLTPGFSPVIAGGLAGNRFNGFPQADKPLKRLAVMPRVNTRLKPGVNEKGNLVTHLCESQ